MTATKPSAPYGSGPATITAGTVPSAADFNSFRDWINWITNPPRCHAYHSAAVSLTNATWTLMQLASEDFDPVGSMHDNVTNNSRVYTPDTGTFLIAASVNYVAGATNGRGLQVRKNAAGNAASGTRLLYGHGQGTSSGDTMVAATRLVSMSAGDYVELFAYQQSTIALSTIAGSESTFLSVLAVAK